MKQPVGPQARNNTLGTPYDRDSKGLRDSAAKNQQHDAVWLKKDHADAICEQFRETAEYREWTLHAVAVMANHFHLLVEVDDDPELSTLLRTFKSYASRRLNSQFGHQEKWWTASGSTRKKVGERSILEAIRYVRDQPNAHMIWLNPVSRFVQKLELFDVEFPKRPRKS